MSSLLNNQRYQPKFGHPKLCSYIWVGKGGTYHWIPKVYSNILMANSTFLALDDQRCILTFGRSTGVFPLLVLQKCVPYASASECVNVCASSSTFMHLQVHTQKACAFIQVIFKCTSTWQNMFVYIYRCLQELLLVHIYRYIISYPCMCSYAGAFIHLQVHM